MKPRSKAQFYESLFVMLSNLKQITEFVGGSLVLVNDYKYPKMKDYREAYKWLFTIHWVIGAKIKIFLVDFSLEDYKRYEEKELIDLWEYIELSKLLNEYNEKIKARNRPKMFKKGYLREFEKKVRQNERKNRKT